MVEILATRNEPIFLARNTLPKKVGHGMWFVIQPQEKEEVKIEAANKEEYLLPLKSVAIEGRIEGPIVTLDIDMTYVNQSADNPIECTYEFPFDKETIVSNLIAKIGDKEVVATVKDKDEAKEKYDDAISQGRAAVYAEQKT